MVLRNLLDTNIILYLLGGRLAQPLAQGEYFASVVTEMELLSYPSIDAEAEGKIRAFLSEITVVGLTPEIVDATIRLRRRYSLKLPDAVVAATALILQAELLTNDLQFSRVDGLLCKAVNVK